MKLVYHTKRAKYSVFDKEILGLVKNEDILIACPYITLKYFERITMSAKSWKLITDAEAFLPNYKGGYATFLKDYIVKNRDVIRHYKGLHCKVIISKKGIFMGSANFTEPGIRKRIELSSTIREKGKIKELQKWYAGIWKDSDLLDPDELHSYVDSLPEEPEVEEEETIRITSNAPKMEKVLVKLR